MTEDRLDQAGQPATRVQTLPDENKRWKSNDHFGDATEIENIHAGALYRLRITRQGKLILNK